MHVAKRAVHPARRSLHALQAGTAGPAPQGPQPASTPGVGRNRLWFDMPDPPRRGSALSHSGSRWFPRRPPPRWRCGGSPPPGSTPVPDPEESAPRTGRKAARLRRGSRCRCDAPASPGDPPADPPGRGPKNKDRTERRRGPVGARAQSVTRGSAPGRIRRWRHPRRRDRRIGRGGVRSRDPFRDPPFRVDRAVRLEPVLI